MGCRSTVFGREPWINTIIGGIAGSISSKSALATKLAISESIIKRFEIVGSDVHAHISATYSIPTLCFDGNTAITSYYDYHGHCNELKTSAFQNCTIVNAYLPNALINDLVYLGASSLTNAYNGGEYIYNPATILGGIGNLKIKKFNAPNVTSIPIDFAKTNTFIEEFTGILTAIPSGGFQGCTNLNLIPTHAITSLGASSMNNCKLEGSRTFNALTSVVGGAGGWKSTEMIFPILANVANKSNQFQNLTNLTLFSARKLKVLGNASLQSNCFSGLKLGCTIEVNIALATANAGAADAALVYAKTSRSAIVKFYDDAGNYVSTL